MNQLRHLACFPLAPLDDDARVGHQQIAAGVVEVEMRVDDEVDVLRFDAELHEPRFHLFAAAVVHMEMLGDATQPGFGVVLAIRVEAGVEQDAALGMVDQVAGHGKADLAVGAAQHHLEVGRHPAAGEGIEADLAGVAGDAGAGC